MEMRSGPLIAAGARLHQSAWDASVWDKLTTNTISLRTMPRNFPGRSGTLDDKIYLARNSGSSSITGKITDQEISTILNISYPQWKNPLKLR
jgi:aconitate hydratase